MSWSYLMVRTRDGGRVGYLDPVDHGSWQRRLDMKSSGSHTFHLASNPTAWERVRPARRTLVICWDEQPVYAGIIWSASYDRMAGTVTINHADIWSIWEKRMAVPTAPETADGGEWMARRWVRYSGLSRPTHMKRVLQMGMRSPEAREGSTTLQSYQLPVILPTDESDTWVFTHRVYNFTSVADALLRIAAPGDPMQIDFPVEFASDGSLRWRLQATYDVGIATPIHLDAPNSVVTSFTVNHDMGEYFSELHATGDGQAGDVTHRLRWLGDIRSDLVALADEQGFSGVEDGEELVGILDSLAQQHRVAAVQANMSISMDDGRYPPTRFALGQSIVVHASDDPVLPRIERGHRFMLIGYSPDGPHGLKLELAPIDGFTGYDTDEPTLRYRNLSAGQFGDITSRLHRAEKRLVYPAGGATAAATTRTTEDT